MWLVSPSSSVRRAVLFILVVVVSTAATSAAEPDAPPAEEFDVPAFHERMDRLAAEIELPAGVDLAVGSPLGSDVVDWARRLAVQRPNLDLAGILGELERREFHFTGGEEVFVIDAAAPEAYVALADGTRLLFRLSSEALEAVDGVRVEGRVRPCRQTPEPLDDDPESRRVGPCFSVANTVGPEFPRWVAIEAFVPVDDPAALDDPDRLSLAVEELIRPLHGDGVTSRIEPLPGTTEVDGGELQLRVTAGPATSAAAPSTLRPADGTLWPGNVYQPTRLGVTRSGCMFVMSNGQHYFAGERPPHRPLGAALTDRIPVFEVCGLSRLAAFLADRTPAVRITAGGIADQLARVWRGMSHDYASFPYLPTRNYPFWTIRVDFRWSNTKCGQANPRYTWAGGTLSLRPTIDLFLYQQTSRGLKRHDGCFPVRSGRLDLLPTAGHELAHVLLDLNRAYWIVDEHARLGGGRGGLDLRQHYHLLKLPL